MRTRRKRQTLRDVINERLQAYQEGVLHVLRVYPAHLQACQLEYLHADQVRYMMDAVLSHLRSVVVEERAELERELFEEGG